MILYHGSKDIVNIRKYGRRNLIKIFILVFIARNIRNRQNVGLHDMEKTVISISMSMNPMIN